MTTVQSPTSVTVAELRQFGIVTSAMFILFFVVLIPWLWGVTSPKWPWFLGASLLTPALVVPIVLKPVYFLWMKFAAILGWINTRIVLSLVYFMLFVPFGVTLRIFRDPMRRELDDESQSYRIPSVPPKIENLEKPF